MKAVSIKNSIKKYIEEEKNKINKDRLYKKALIKYIESNTDEIIKNSKGHIEIGYQYPYINGEIIYLFLSYSDIPDDIKKLYNYSVPSIPFYWRGGKHRRHYRVHKLKCLGKNHMNLKNELVEKTINDLDFQLNKIEDYFLPNSTYSKEKYKEYSIVYGLESPHSYSDCHDGLGYYLLEKDGVFYENIGFVKGASHVCFNQNNIKKVESFESIVKLFKLSYDHKLRELISNVLDFVN